MHRSISRNCAAEHRGAAVVEDDDVIFVRPVRIAGAARAGRERRVDRHLLRGRRARQHAQQLRHVLQRRHDLLDRGEHDVHARQGLRQVAIALVGDDDRRAGLGHQEIRAGDADIGREEAVAQDHARLGEQRLVLLQIAVGRQMRVHAAEVGLDLLLGEMHRRHDDVRRQLVADLHQVFAEVGLDRRDAVRSRKSLIAISSPIIDLPLVTSFASALRQMSSTSARASSAVTA